jgi:hypothetical protein
MTPVTNNFSTVVFSIEFLDLMVLIMNLWLAWFLSLQYHNFHFMSSHYLIQTKLGFGSLAGSS